MPAGGMDQLVTIQRKTLVPDGYGGFTAEWDEVATVWAKVMPKAGRESQVEGRQAATFVAVFEVYQSGLEDLTELDRIEFCGENWNIRGRPRPGERAQTIKVEAERGVAQ